MREGTSGGHYGLWFKLEDYVCVCGFIQVSEEEERVKHAGCSAFTVGPSDHPP